MVRSSGRNRAAAPRNRRGPAPARRGCSRSPAAAIDLLDLIVEPLEAGRGAVGKVASLPTGTTSLRAEGAPEAIRKGKERPQTPSTAPGTARGNRESPSSASAPRPEPMVAPREGDHPRLAAVQQRGFQRDLHGVRARELPSTTLPTPAPQRSNVNSLSRAHSSAFRCTLGCTSPIACSNSPDLRHQRRDDARISMTEPGHPKGGREIEKAIAVRVPHIRARGAFPKDRKIIRDVGDIARLMSVHSVAASARERGPGISVLSEGSMNCELAARPDALKRASQRQLDTLPRSVPRRGPTKSRSPSRGA